MIGEDVLGVTDKPLVPYTTKGTETVCGAELEPDADGFVKVTGVGNEIVSANDVNLPAVAALVNVEREVLQSPALTPAFADDVADDDCDEGGAEDGGSALLEEQPLATPTRAAVVAIIPATLPNLANI